MKECVRWQWVPGATHGSGGKQATSVRNVGNTQGCQRRYIYLVRTLRWQGKILWTIEGLDGGCCKISKEVSIWRVDSRVYVDIRTPRIQSKLAERRLEGLELPDLKQPCIDLLATSAAFIQMFQVLMSAIPPSQAVLRRCGVDLLSLDECEDSLDEVKRTQSSDETIVYEDAGTEGLNKTIAGQ